MNIRCFIFILFLNAFAGHSYPLGTIAVDEQALAIQQAELDAMQPELDAALTAMNAEFTAMSDQLAQEQKKMFLHSLETLGQGSGIFDAFKKTELYAIKKPTHDLLSKEPASVLDHGVSLYGEDIINFALFSGHSIVEFFFYSKLKKHYSGTLTKVLTLHHQEFCNLMNAVNRNTDGTLVKDEKLKALHDFFIKKCFTDNNKKILRDPHFLALIIFYCAQKELLASIESIALDESSFSKRYLNPDYSLFENLTNSERTLKKAAIKKHKQAIHAKKYKKSLSSCIKIILPFIQNKSLIAILAPYCSFIRTILMRFITTPELCKTIAESNLFYFTKKITGALWFVHNIENLHIIKWQKLIENNIDELTVLLSHDSQNITNEDNQTLIKDFVNEKALTSLLPWWRFKEHYMAHAEITLEVLILIPTLITTFELIQKHFFTESSIEPNTTEQQNTV